MDDDDDDDDDDEDEDLGCDSSSRQIKSVSLKHELDRDMFAFVFMLPCLICCVDILTVHWM